MGLRLKFNLGLLVVFFAGLALAAFLADQILRDNAREEVLQNARIMMESAMAIRTYTAKEINPLLSDQLAERFLPQTVSAYAATQNLDMIRKTFSDYVYKEAALNPTNPMHRASDWEADIINTFRNKSDMAELIVQRSTPTGEVLNLARPLQVTYERCLQCHGQPAKAPASLIDQYGAVNGFGWKVHEVIGAQIVSVPMSVPLARATRAMYVFMAALIGVFLLVFILVNIMLHVMVIKPVETISEIASEVSMGKLESPEYVKRGKDEVASLSQSFNRMRRSLVNALKMLED